MSAGRQGREHQQIQFVFCYNRQLGRDASVNNRSGPSSEQPSPPASRFRVSKCLFHLHVVISWLYIYTSAIHFLQVESRYKETLSELSFHQYSFLLIRDEFQYTFTEQLNVFAKSSTEIKSSNLHLPFACNTLRKLFTPISFFKTHLVHADF